MTLPRSKACTPTQSGSNRIADATKTRTIKRPSSVWFGKKKHLQKSMLHRELARVVKGLHSSCNGFGRRSSNLLVHISLTFCAWRPLPASVLLTLHAQI